VKHLFLKILCLSLFIPFHVHAMTAQELLDKCSHLPNNSAKEESPQRTVSRIMDAGSCAGFVGGVISGINLIGNMMMQKKIIEYNFFCLPQAAHSQELLNLTLEHIKKNKKLASSRAEVAVFHIFNSKFSCAEKAQDKS